MTDRQKMEVKGAIEPVLDDACFSANDGFSNLAFGTNGTLVYVPASVMEELEAVDWYNQRVDACNDKHLKAILAHNRDEEKEHAAMVLEWIRRQDPTFDKELKDFLYTDKPIAHD